MEITGNEDPMIVTTRSRNKWRPAGRITYFDDVTNTLIGLEGIKVKARRWFTTHTGFVNAQGYYSCDGQFKRDANYSFDFERYDFHVKGKGVKTDYNGPKKTGNWNYEFKRTSSQSEYFGATIFRAAYHYYYKNIGGLRRPPQNGFLKTQMKLKAFNESDGNNGTFNSARRFLGGNMIKLYNPSNGTMELYATAIHELAHAAHWKMIVKEPGTNRVRDYHNAEEKVLESWARGVQYFLTRMAYSNYRGGATSSKYTNVVVDLIDTDADNASNNGYGPTNGDNVTGYTMCQIEDALIGINTWIKWKDNIKKYNNATKNNVDALFASW